MDSYLLAKKDLETFSSKDIAILAKKYNLSNIDNENDLLWLLVLNIHHKQTASMENENSSNEDPNVLKNKLEHENSPLNLSIEDPNILKIILDNANLKTALNMCSTNTNLRKYCTKDFLQKKRAKQADLDSKLLKYVGNYKLPKVEAILKAGADVNVKDYRGWTPLHVVSRAGISHLEIIKVLLENGVNVNEKNYDGETPLHLASRWDNLEIVKVLLENGANIHEKTRNYNTPLDYASGNGNLEVVKVLLDNGAIVHDKDKNKMSSLPLHYASRRGHLEIVKLVLEYGANVNEKNNDGC